MTDAEYGELLRAVGLAAKTNMPAIGIKPPFDGAFDKEQT